MLTRYIHFIRALSINWIGRLGVVLTTASFVTFVIFLAAEFAGLVTNAYAGLVTFLVLPVLFVVGLILVPIGWHKRRKETGKTTRELIDERFEAGETARGFFGSRVFLVIASLTVVNILFLGIVSSRMLAFMDESHFCGTACHEVMNPEWVTYQESPHARVKCVECHVGEGFGALIDSKINGVYQILSVTFDLLERPIPTPVKNLRPSRETCEKCHWPEKFYGRRLKTVARYAKDSGSTPAYNTLSLKVDAGHGGERSGIHWHIAEENQVRYASVGDERKEMIWVDVRQPDGSFKRYVNRRLSAAERSSEERVLDCVDCHNRATHIYENPEDAVDERIELRLIDRSLPFVKREAIAALTSRYPDEEAAMRGIANRLRGFYERRFPDVASSKGESIDAAIAVLQGVYKRNIHHQMNITWGTYTSLVGHAGETGCFRCHSPKMTDDAGNEISGDCTLCHSILAYESTEPFAFVQTPRPGSADYGMHEYLRNEFLRSSEK